MSGDWCAAGIAIDHLPAGEFAEQDRCGAARRGYARSVRRGSAWLCSISSAGRHAPHRTCHRCRGSQPGRVEIFDIDDTFCAAHGGQQLAFWNAHHDERGFASMHIYHVASGAPVATILRPARTPKGTEVRTVIKTKRLKQHWPD